MPRGVTERTLHSRLTGLWAIIGAEIMVAFRRQPFFEFIIFGAGSGPAPVGSPEQLPWWSG